MSLHDGLVAFWDFEALGSTPAGAVVADLANGLSLQLRRTPRTSSDTGSIAEGWVTTPGGKRAFNGQGLVELGERLALDAPGDAITLVARWWSMYPPSEPVGQGCDVLGAVGRLDNEPSVLHGVHVEAQDAFFSGTPIQPALVFYQRSEEVGFDQVVIGASELSLTVVTIVMHIEFVAEPTEYEDGEAKVTVYVNGVLCEPGDIPCHNAMDGGGSLRGIDTDRFTCGDYSDSNGAVLSFGIWAGIVPVGDLDDEDLDDLVDDLTGEMAGPGTANPLLNPDGTLGVNIEWPVPRTVADAGVIVSPDVIGAAGRHTRRTHERAERLRRYELVFNAADDNDVERIRQAVVITAGGAGTTRFRHPVDDAPGPVSTAPLIRIVEVGQWERNRGGNVGSCRLVIEYM